MWVSLTGALGMAAFVESVTIPVIAPRSDCPKHVDRPKMAINNTVLAVIGQPPTEFIGHRITCPTRSQRYLSVSNGFTKLVLLLLTEERHRRTITDEIRGGLRRLSCG